MKNISLLIKPSSSLCNLECSYCFYNSIAEERERANYGFMSLETLENIIKKAFEFSDGGQCSFAFQGGEPTLIGLNFFKNFIHFVNIYNKKNSKVFFALQTNGILIDNEWANFLKENNFLVGLSLDGDDSVHNHNRKFKNGLGSFEDVIKCKEIFDKIGVEYNILSVVDNVGAENISNTYQFLKKLNIQYMQFIPCLNPLLSGVPENSANLSKENYLKFLKNLFDLWYADLEKGDVISIRYFENILMNLLKINPESCEMRGSCSIQNVIEADGSLYPCDFYVYEKYRLGNINSQTLEEMIFSDQTRNFIESSLLYNEKCLNCKWKQICKGGCKRYYYNSSENFYCNEISQFLEYSIERFYTIARHLG